MAHNPASPTIEVVATRPSIESAVFASVTRKLLGGVCVSTNAVGLPTRSTLAMVGRMALLQKPPGPQDMA